MGYYVVFEGRQRGIFSDWFVCKSFVDKYKGNIYKKYHSKEEAEEAFNRYMQQETTMDAKTAGAEAVADEGVSVESVGAEAVSDGACVVRSQKPTPSA